METSFFLVIFTLSLLFVGAKLIRIQLTYSRKVLNLPPGSSGWPFLGESLQFLRANWKGCPERFIADRVEKYESSVFRTSLFGEQIAVLCGPAGNKFVFSNEGKKVEIWWPPPLRRLVGPSLINRASHEVRAHKKLLMGSFFSTESLMKCVPVMDDVTRRHLAADWEGKEEIEAYSSLIKYMSEVTCKIFMSVVDPGFVSRITHHFDVFRKGLVEIPLDIPGMRFHSAMRAADALRKELRALVRQRRTQQQPEGAGTEASPAMQDLLSFFMTTSDEDGNLMSEEEVVNSIIGLLFAGYESNSATITLLLKWLSEQPLVYKNVLREQRQIAVSKGPGQLLEWQDLQRMKYSWNVVSEVMRITPPVFGGFREAMVDIDYGGYTVPKGWKLLWSATYTHKDPKSFPMPMEFDESRFQGSGPLPFSYVPFGGGTRMCPGKEFARLNILVFLHNIVNQFEWETASQSEKWIYDPLITPANGLPILLRPLTISNK